MKIAYKHAALAIVAAALAAAIAPAAEIAPSAWAEKNLIVADGPYKGEPLNLALTPYWREPLDFFADACPDEPGGSASRNRSARRAWRSRRSATRLRSSRAICS
jgi:hypothetical protein